MNTLPYKVIIIEDEQPAREIVKAYLSKHDDFTLIGEFDNGFDGAVAIKNLQPDMVFLDIQMPKLTGFEVLELVDSHPVIVFTTAYDEFALKAFEISAIDYLLKPFLQSRFDKAIQKARLKLSQTEPKTDNFAPLLEFARATDEIINRIVVKVNNKFEMVLVESIEHIEAQDDYVYIFTISGERFIKDFTMKYLENHLNPQDFVRVHRSHIVRVDRISRLERETESQSYILLKSGCEIPVSKSGFQRLRDLLKI